MITITLPDGTTRPFAAAITGADIASSIAPSLRKKAAAIAIDGGLADLSTSIDRDARVETRDDPIDHRALRQFLVRLTSTPGNGLLRIKGLVALQDDPASPALIHAVQHRLYPIARLEAWPNGAASSRLVVIGTNLDEGAMRAEFAALSGKPQPFLAMAFQAFKQGGRPFG